MTSLDKQRCKTSAGISSYASVKSRRTDCGDKKIDAQSIHFGVRRVKFNLRWPKIWRSIHFGVRMVSESFRKSCRHSFCLNHWDRSRAAFKDPANHCWLGVSPRRTDELKACLPNEFPFHYQAVNNVTCIRKVRYSSTPNWAIKKARMISRIWKCLNYLC